MKVLIACEESQTECKAFRALGHEAYSCDIIDCSGGHPEWHIKGDALEALRSQDWDLVIAHPPCTYLSNAGACRLYRRIDGKQYINMERYELGIKAKAFFMEFVKYGSEGHRLAIENPVPLSVYNLPEKSQVIQPYEYGHPYSKKTYLWLYNLPPLMPTDILADYKPYVSCGTSKNKGNADKAGVSRKGGASKVRSLAFKGIAEAMANQWSIDKE